jgi:hypothetical protein
MLLTYETTHRCSLTRENIMNRIRNTIIASLALAGTFGIGSTASAAPEYPSDQTLFVQLVDARSAEPIPGAKVSVYSYVTGETALTTSDRYGRVKVSSLYGDEFAVKVQNTRWHCGGQLMANYFDEVEHANLIVNPDDGSSFSAGYLGVAAMTQRSASGRC